MYGRENGYTKEEQVFNLKCVEDKVPVKEDRSRCPLYATSSVKIFPRTVGSVLRLFTHRCHKASSSSVQ